MTTVFTHETRAFAVWFGLLLIPLTVSPAHCAEEPVALVEAVAGTAGSRLQVMDSLYAGQVIELGASGQLSLAYLNSCRIERIAGGRVTIGALESRVEGGRIDASAAPCQASGVVVAQGQQEVAGAVYRVTAFKDQDWGERTIRSANPIFRWVATSNAGLYALAVIDMDRQPPAVVWKGVTEKGSLTYPGDAPPLEVGVPYQVQVSASDGSTQSAHFSIDPGLEGQETVLGRLVPLRPNADRK